MEHHAGFAHRQSVHVWCLYYVRVVPVHPSMVAYIVITIIVRLCMPRHKGKRREREPGAEVSLATTHWFNAKTYRCSAPALFIDVYPLITPPPSTTAEIQLVKKRARCVSRPPPCSVPRWHRHASHFTPKQTLKTCSAHASVAASTHQDKHDVRLCGPVLGRRGSSNRQDENSGQHARAVTKSHE